MGKMIDKGFVRYIRNAVRKFSKVQGNVNKQNANHVKIPIIKSIRLKLICAFLISVILIIAMGVITYIKFSDSITRNYEKATSNTLNMMDNYYSFALNYQENKAVEIITDDNLKKYYSGYYSDSRMDEIDVLKNIKANVKKIKYADENLDEILIVGQYGQMISTQINESNDNIFEKLMDTQEVQELINSGDTSAWIGKHSGLDELLKRNVDSGLSYIRFVKDAKNKQSGLIFIDISRKFILDGLNENSLPSGSISGFITADNYEITNGKDEDFSFIKQGFVSEAMKNQDDKSGYRYVDYQGQKYMLLYTKVDICNGLICVLIPRSVVVADADAMKQLTFILITIAAVIAIIVGTMFSAKIGKTIKQISAPLEATSNGDLTERVKLTSSDEFKLIGLSINHMLDNMRDLIQNTKHITDNVTTSSENIADTSETLVKATQNINHVVSMIETGINSQADDATNCNMRMRDLAERISEVYQNTVEIAKIADDTKSTVSNGISIVNNLSDAVKVSSDVTESAIDDIQELMNQFTSIHKIILIINDIASQTNLLSLNASIEAARAGDFGRGFAVVAEEIGKLADQSMRSSGEIKKMMDDIQNKTKTVVLSIQKTKESRAFQESSLNSVIVTFNDIIEHVEYLNHSLSGISKGISVIETNKDETLNFVENITAALEEIASSTTELVGTAENQLNSTEMLNSDAESLKNEAIELKENIDKYQI
jgi:methyl-accepting chemotaxis protein